MAKDERIAVRVDTATKTALARAAEKDERTMSSLAGKIITDWLRAEAKRVGKGKR